MSSKSQVTSMNSDVNPQMIHKPADTFYWIVDGMDIIIVEKNDKKYNDKNIKLKYD
jgi:hypothetical protein